MYFMEENVPRNCSVLIPSFIKDWDICNTLNYKSKFKKRRRRIRLQSCLIHKSEHASFLNFQLERLENMFAIEKNNRSKEVSWTENSQ